MKTVLEQQDIEAIARRVIELLQPLMTAKVKCVDDAILDMNALALYLKVNKSWIYKRTKQYEIPFIKKGKYCLFRKSDIDAWLNKDAVKPLPSSNTPKKTVKRHSDCLSDNTNNLYKNNQGFADYV